MTDLPFRRELGTSNIMVSPVALGCWPIAGMTSLDVNDTDSLNTLQAAFDAGVNFLDTAFCYGRNGESEKLIGQAFAHRRDEVVIATKCGIHWNDDGGREIDGRSQTLVAQCEESLRRLQTDHVDLLYLHAPDPRIPIAESATALQSLLHSGKTRTVGVSNFSVSQMTEFHSICPITACQPAYNMLQRQIEHDIVPWCLAHQASIVPYWPLLKGLLAGKLPRDYQFQPGDGRPKYPMFQGEEWERNQDFLDELRKIAQRCNKAVAELAVNWLIQQPAIASALCGAKRPYQIEENAAAMTWEMDSEIAEQIAAALARRGTPIVRTAV
ncbi:MAG: aryl-alcohol dehydrogenase-like predicted oxidoreductase [Mariniblastus sp.]|jgi:aryl-alcohol dehydrogenase-like predicted oxidoreductase